MKDRKRPHETLPSVARWRYIEDDDCRASLGLATDEYLARSLSSQTSRLDTTHTLRLYTYGEPCALVGKYQEVHSEIDLEYCKTHGIAINRRPTGGGTIVMGKGQLGVAIAMPLSEDFSLLKLSMVFARYSRGLLNGLKRLGIQAEFRPRNDILSGGRKIAGLAFATMGSSGLFHASLLADLDEEVMEKALRVSPMKKASLTTASRELERTVTTHELRQSVREGYQEAFGVELVDKPLSREELAEIESLERSRYKNPVWIYDSKPFYVGEGH